MPDPSPGRRTASPTQLIASGQVNSRSISLQRAAAVLESTHNRIRNRLSELDLTLAPPPIPATNTDAIGPSHTAIVLSNTRDSGTNSDSDARLDVPPTAMERLELYEAFVRRQETSRNGPTGVVFISAARNNSPPPLHSNVDRPSTSHPLGASRSWLESMSGRRRELESNDPSTFLGRRVAAREALSHFPDADPPALYGQDVLIGLLNSRAASPNLSTQPASSSTFEGPPPLRPAESASRRIPSYPRPALIPALVPRPLSSVSVRVTTHAPEVDFDGIPELAEPQTNDNEGSNLAPFIGHHEWRGNEMSRINDVDGVEPVYRMGDTNFLVQTLARSGAMVSRAPERPFTPPDYIRPVQSLRGPINQQFPPQGAFGSTNAAIQTMTQRRGWSTCC
jgi:hypothetical protein